MAWHYFGCDQILKILLDIMLLHRKNGDTVGALSKAINEVDMFYAILEFSIVCEIVNFGCE